MRKVVKALEELYLSRRPAGANIQCRDEDVMIVSYPKSGNTWLRCFLSNLLCEGEISLNEMDEIVPDIYKATHGELNRITNPRYLKSHESFRVDYKKVIYIVRDPRDVLVSSYYYCLKTRRITDSITLESFVDPFIAGEFFSGFGTWHEHVGSWLGARKEDSKSLFLKYEEIIADQFQNAKIISEFLNLNKSDEIIKLAIKASSLDSMRKLEQASTWKSEKGDQRQDIPFVRAGKSGQGKQELSSDSLQKIENAWGELMTEFKYLR